MPARKYPKFDPEIYDEPKPGFAPILIIGIVTALIILIVAIFFQLTPRTQTSSQQQNQQATQSAASNPTANWQTYSNTNYSIKYPISWTNQPKNSVTETPDNVTSHISTVQISSQEPNPVYNLQITTQDKYSNSLDTFYKAYTSGQKVYDERPIDLDGETGIRYSRPAPKNQSQYYEEVLVKHKDLVINIEFLIGSVDATQTKYLDTFNEILSTFKFTQESASTDLNTTNWKIYTNNKLHFQIKLPQTVGVRSENSDNKFNLYSIEFGIGKSLNPNYLGGDTLTFVASTNDIGKDPKTVYETEYCPRRGESACDVKTAPAKINNAIGIIAPGLLPLENDNYYLTNGTKTIPVVRIFYTQAITNPEKALFEKIISTFNFTQ